MTGRAARAPARTKAWALGLALMLAAAGTACGAEIVPGSTIKPKAALPLREAPPSGLVGAKGETIGTVRPDTEYKVLEQKTFSTLLGSENWLRIQETTNPAHAGWIYSGTKEQPFGNVTAVVR